MDGVEIITGMIDEQDRRITEDVEREKVRLRDFIRKHVLDEGDAEDILQEVFYELVQTYRLMKPVEKVGAWLFRVARNRIIDRFRRRKPEVSMGDDATRNDEGESFQWEDVLPSPEVGPDAAYAREILLEELESAIGDLPDEQREVFVAHEVEGRSFKELAASTGISVNTLLSRKHYAVLNLRRRLRAIHDEFNPA
jgi:RNA polymerase sigma factor (sigma-70 family)